MKRLITEVLDIKSGQFINSTLFFNQDRETLIKKRRELEEYYQNNEKVLVCPECLEPINIRGLKGRKILHFSHYSDKKDCILKTKGMTKKEIELLRYMNVKESEKHIYLKNMIAELIGFDNKFSSESIKVDKWYKADDYKDTKRYRLPDVQANYENKKIAFEIQLTSTFLSVIADRETFYKNEEVFIIWIFDTFDTNTCSRKIMEEDIYYLNKNNVFVLDKERIEKSKKEKTLILLCNYLNQNNIWESIEVKFNELKFDYRNYKLFYKDIEEFDIVFMNKWIESENTQTVLDSLSENIDIPYTNLLERKNLDMVLKAVYAINYGKFNDLYEFNNYRQIIAYVLNRYNLIDDENLKEYTKVCIRVLFEILLTNKDYFNKLINADKRGLISNQMITFQNDMYSVENITKYTTLIKFFKLIFTQYHKNITNI